MYAVGKLSSYITQGVYTVSGPFHPFGGAVDMVVVQQQDGSLKSSPWYVRFGKFQGVLKAKERVVDINVNGVDADFHMYLDPRGEAYFLREVDSEEEVVDTASSPSSLCEEIDGNGKHPVKSKSMNYDFDHSNSVDVTDGKVLTRTNSKRSRILGFVLGRRSMNEHILSKEENDQNHSRTASLEGEIAADLLEMKWSTNFSSRSNMKDCKDSRKDNGEIIGGRLEASLVLHEQHFVNKLESFKEVDEALVADIVHGVDKDLQNEHNGSVENCVPEEDSEVGLVKDEGPIKIVTERCSEIASNKKGDTSVVVSCSTVAVDESNEIRPPLEPHCEFQDVSSDSVVIKQISERVVEEQLIDDLTENRPSLEFHDVSADSVVIKQVSERVVEEQFIDEPNEIRQRLESNGEFQDVLPDSVVIKQVTERVVEEQVIDESNESRPSLEFQDVASDSVVIKQVSEQVVEEQLIFKDLDDSKPSINNIDLQVNPPPIKLHQEPLKLEIKGVKGNIKRYRSNIDIPSIREFTKDKIGRRAKSLPNMWSHFDDPVPDNHEDSQFYSPVAKFRSSNWDLVREDASRIIKGNLEKALPQNADPLSKDLKDGSLSSGSDSASGSWSLWPFRRLGSRNVSPKEQNIKKDSEVDIVPDADGEKEACSPSSNKHKRSLTPTPEQLASLNLAEGRNIVTFTFSTSVLGPQKVDARIYLWRWDTRIVISDVDGTITKSDVLGQFMPLVGRDWSHIGVTHLFSGIKENGYQMLYLSARAISQASITRQFLFNLKQDGKALPDGPVVISPDGLFPSLFREVIRRAPHEFKIACLEDIKACFPSDRNPFYAGFGNRDTDEFSYLKVGIPKGKIFIINPKGEVVVNRCIDSKSYASLHALVHGIFPTITVHEEEDYNSWNFWKLPPPIME